MLLLNLLAIQLVAAKVVYVTKYVDQYGNQVDEKGNPLKAKAPKSPELSNVAFQPSKPQPQPKQPKQPAQPAPQQPQQSPAAQDGPSDSTFEGHILAKHNSARAAYNAPAVSWDPALASTAQQAADTCVFAHTSIRGDAGENIYESSAAMDPIKAAEEALGMWVNGEAPAYAQMLQGGGQGTFSSATGHFTQVVWKATTTIGCALSTCGGSKTLLFCHYRVAGNLMSGDSFNQNVDVQASLDYAQSNQKTGVVDPMGQSQQYNSAPQPQQPQQPQQSLQSQQFQYPQQPQQYDPSSLAGTRLYKRVTLRPRQQKQQPVRVSVFRRVL